MATDSGTSKAPVQWHPISLLRDSRNRSIDGIDFTDKSEDGRKIRFALIILKQPITNYLGIIRRLWNNAFTHIAADGGANCLWEAAGKHGDSSFDNLRGIVGDLDSLSAEAREYFVHQKLTGRATDIVHFPDQESTDFGKAINYVRDQYSGPVHIVAVGGLGGRVDQAISQLHHLFSYQVDPNYSEGRLCLFTGEGLTFLLKAGSHEIHVRDGTEEVFDKWVGILPIKEPSRITTKGLEWDVTDWHTELGGLVSTSNHVLPETKTVWIHTTKDVLFTIALKQF
ncbi:hypothetical protein OQA88_9146 [Cercophora sp. LCS_1]